MALTRARRGLPAASERWRGRPVFGAGRVYTERAAACGTEVALQQVEVLDAGYAVVVEVGPPVVSGVAAALALGVLVDVEVGDVDDVVVIGVAREHKAHLRVGLGRSREGYRAAVGKEPGGGVGQGGAGAFDPPVIGAIGQAGDRHGKEAAAVGRLARVVDFGRTELEGEGDRLLLAGVRLRRRALP